MTKELGTQLEHKLYPLQTCWRSCGGRGLWDPPVNLYVGYREGQFSIMFITAFASQPSSPLNSNLSPISARKKKEYFK